MKVIFAQFELFKLNIFRFKHVYVELFYNTFFFVYKEFSTKFCYLYKKTIEISGFYFFFLIKFQN